MCKVAGFPFLKSTVPALVKRGGDVVCTFVLQGVIKFW